jgi:hypothetical protein
MNNFGIDKLTISTPYFEIKNLTNVNINPNVKKAGEQYIKETHLFNHITNDGEEISVGGSKVYLNQPDFNFTVKLLGNKVQSILQFNPSKIIGELTTNPNAINDATKKVIDQLNSFGINIDLPSAVTSRIDLACDQHLKRTYKEYSSIIIGKTALKKENTVDYVDTKTFGTGKGTIQFSTYDKGKEREQSLYGKPTSNSTHHIRFESRILKGKGVKRIIGEADTYERLLNCNDRQYHKAYLRVLESSIQIDQTQIELPDISTAVDIMKLMQRIHPKTWLQQSLYVLQTAYKERDTENIIEMIDYAIELAMEGKTRQAIHKQRKQLFALETEASFLRQRLVKESEQSRYDKQRELIDAFIIPFRDAV